MRKVNTVGKRRVPVKIIESAECASLQSKFTTQHVSTLQKFKTLDYICKLVVF